MTQASFCIGPRVYPTGGAGASQIAGSCLRSSREVLPVDADRKELAELLRAYDTALLITRDREGHFHARPMAVQRRPFEDDLWFATRLDSRKVEDLQADPACGVAFWKGGHSPTYLSLSGEATVVRDRETIHEMWEPTWKAWFPHGVDDPDLVLLRIRPERAEWVHPTTGRLGVWGAALIRAVRGSERPEPAEKREFDLTEGL